MYVMFVLYHNRIFIGLLAIGCTILPWLSSTSSGAVIRIEEYTVRLC